MSRVSMIFLAAAICLMCQVSRYSQSKNRGSEIPEGIMSVLIVSDPKCPVQIAGPAKVIGYSEGGFQIGYMMSNVSNVNVESFSIEGTDWFAATGYRHSYIAKEEHVFAPGSSWYSLSEKDYEDLIPYTENKGLQIRAVYPRNRIWIVMVVKVKLSDGSVYDASDKFKRLEGFLSRDVITSPDTENDLNKRDTKTRGFIEKLVGSEN